MEASSRGIAQLVVSSGYSLQTHLEVDNPTLVHTFPVESVDVETSRIAPSLGSDHLGADGADLSSKKGPSET